MSFGRWLLNLSLALVGCAILYFPDPAKAQTCFPLQQIEGLVEQLPSFRILSGAPLVNAVALFNRNPPETETPWASAYLAIRPDGFGVLMVGMDGTVCAAMLIKPDDLQEVLRKIDGESA